MVQNVFTIRNILVIVPNLLKSLHKKNLGSLKSHINKRYIGNKQKVRYLISLRPCESQVPKRGLENVCENRDRTSPSLPLLTGVLGSGMVFQFYQ